MKWLFRSSGRLARRLGPINTAGEPPSGSGGVFHQDDAGDQQKFIGFRNILLGGGFKDFLFSSLFGEDSHFDYFSKGLKPPTSLRFFLFLKNKALIEGRVVHD